MKTYRIYMPWDTVSVEANSEEQAKQLALEVVRSEVESYEADMLDAEEIDGDEE
jgi:hypothetical protein